MHKMLSIVVLLGLGANLAAARQTDMPKPAYDFTLPREERIKLAESAAPPEISAHATLYLLEKTGYVRTREGTNVSRVSLIGKLPSIRNQPVSMLKDPQPPCQPDCMSRSSGPRARTKNRSRQKLTRVTRAENIRRQPNPALYICCPITFTFWFPAPARWLRFHLT